jgi:hypothetical protein
MKTLANSNKTKHPAKRARKEQRENTEVESQKQTRGCVSHFGLAIFTLKSVFKAIEELWKLKYFISLCKNIIFKKKKSSKRNQNPLRYYYNSYN